MVNAWWLDAWQDGLNVAKATIRDSLRDFTPSYYATPSLVQTYTLSGAKSIIVAGTVYELDAADVSSAHAPPAVIVSLNGGRYKPKFGSAREVLSAARTYYVRTDGSDVNTGLADNAGGAFLTIQKAVDVVATLDTATFDVTVQVRDGTRTAGVVLKDAAGSGNLNLVGNVTTPANCFINLASGFCIDAGLSRNWKVRGFKLACASGGAIFADNVSRLNINGNMEYGACSGAHFYALSSSNIRIDNSYSITGGALMHWRAEINSTIRCLGVTITLTGTPAFGTAFTYCDATAVAYVGANTFSGAATGTRYAGFLNSAISTQGGGATYFPGNAAGSVSSGAQYV